MKLLVVVLFIINWPVSALMLTGEVESSQTQEIIMPMVRSWRAEIADMATEGSRVAPGDFVVRIDGSDLDATIEAQQEALDVYVAASKRDMTQLQIDLNNAHLAYEKAQVDQQIAELKASVPLEFIGELAFKERQLALKQSLKTLADNKKKYQALQLRIKEKQKEVDLGLEQKHKELVYWQERLQNLTMNAQQDGFVIHATHPWNGTKYQIGDQVRTGLVIAKVSKTTDMRVKAWINAIDLPKISQDKVVTVQFDALPHVKLSGKISHISAGGHDKKNWGEGLYYEIIVALKNGNDIGLLPGMSALVWVEDI
ncbi:MAG: HlyD family efflux transporter periplasmic adaptor subunit [Proteobacteria bacterium]|nr:MAG: HlyD family efflux transporter periplasmic adaptor subunit [Pseudomonadota bacterium]